MMFLLLCTLLMQFERDLPDHSGDNLSYFIIAVLCILIVGNVIYAVVVVLDNRKFAAH